MSEHSDEAAALVNILRAALTDTLTQKTQLSHVRTPTHRNCEKITADCFKPLNLVVICSKAVNKECLCTRVMFSGTKIQRHYNLHWKIDCIFEVVLWEGCERLRSIYNWTSGIAFVVIIEKLAAWNSQTVLSC